MSQFLRDVERFSYVTRASRVGNHVMCYMESDGKEIHFLATDNNDWHGTLTAQLQRELTAEQGSNVRVFLRQLKHHSRFFDIGCHDLTNEVRGTITWPLYADYFGAEDAAFMIHTLFELWTTIEPYILKVCDGGNVDELVQLANQELLRQRPANPPIVSA